jgi:outer membrane receptor protein involved in Fe transport
VTPGKRLPILPDRLFKAFAQARLADGWTLGAEWLAVGSSYARGNENNLHQPDGNIYLGSGRNPGYGLLNATLSWDFAPAWTLSAKINNLLDKRYSTGAVLGATPFNASGGLDARQMGSYVEGDGSRSYVVRQTTFQAPGAPRQGFVSLAYRFD